MTVVSFPLQTFVEYPESDGKPLAESPLHFEVFSYLLNGFMAYFQEEQDIYVGGGNFFYYREGHPSANLVPDNFIVKGLDKEPRRTFKTWVEKRVPSVVIEITSEFTWLEDFGDKKILYQQLGVGEYFVYDPEQEMLALALHGFRLDNKRYEAIQYDPENGMPSREFGFALKIMQGKLRIVNPNTGSIMPTYQELCDSSRQLASQKKLLALQHENARLRAELDALRRKQG